MRKAIGGVNRRGQGAVLLVACVLISCLAYASTSAQDKKDQKGKSWCRHEDVLGAWRMVYLQEKPEGEITRLQRAAPFRYLFFADNGQFMRVSTNQYVKEAKSVLGLLQTASGEAGFKYQLGDDGRMVLRLGNEPVEQFWCQVVPATSGGYEKGDIIMTSGNSQFNVTQVFRKIAAQ